MLLKNNRKGLTGIIDAMIFITIMSVVFSALYAYNINDTDTFDIDASDISNEILSSKFCLDDIIYTDDSRLVSFTDLLAAATLTGDERTIDYLRLVLNSATGRSDSYRMTVIYGNNTFTIGIGEGVPLSSCTETTAVTYGGSMTTILELF
jgi:hypothetical protein